MGTGKTTGLARIALSVALMAICAWIQIPMVIPVTMQTFAVLTVSCLLGAESACCAVLVYLLLGLVGVPVFSGFQAGAAILFSATGGYLLGFLFTALITGSLAGRAGCKTTRLALSMGLGLAVCYMFGTVWFSRVYAAGTGFGAALRLCVLPYLLPDALKIALAFPVVRRVKPLLSNLPQ